MKYRLKFTIVASAVLCLSLAAVAPADSCIKTLYVDGAYVGNANTNQGLTFINRHIKIGVEGPPNFVYNEYTENMDEFAIYAGVLDAGRITAHYAARSTSYAAYASAVDADDPLLWLKFDDSDKTNGATAANSGSASMNGVHYLTGTKSFASIAGIAAGSNALAFPDAESAGKGAWVDVDDTSGELSTALDGDVTIELWVKLIEIDDYVVTANHDPRLFQHNGGEYLVGGYGVDINEPNQLGIIGGGETNFMNTPYDINDNSWHHIVVTYDSNYIITPPPVTGTYTEEVSADNPVLWLRFEDEEPKDYSAYANNRWVGYGSAASIVEKVGGIGNSVCLDGTEGSNVYPVAATNNPNEPPMDPNEAIGYHVFGDQYAFVPNDITFEIWVRSPPPGQPLMHQYGVFFQQMGAQPEEPRAPGVTNSDGQIRFFAGSEIWYTDVPTPSSEDWYTCVPQGNWSTGTTVDDEWHHLVATFDEEYGGDPCSMHMQLYMDGKLITSHTSTGADAKLGPELSHIMVGAARDIGNTENYFAGYIDEFAIYEGILDPNRVLVHYVAWSPKNCADVWARGYGRTLDINQDCMINFADIAGFALRWRTCNDPCDPGCIPPNW